MSEDKRSTLKGGFLDVIRRAIQEDDQWNTMPGWVELCDKAGIWGDDFLERTVYRTKATMLRHLFQTLKDENGLPLFPSIEVIDESTGKPVRVYKQLKMFGITDCRQVIKYHRSRGNHHFKMARAFQRWGKKKWGDQLEFDF